MKLIKISLVLLSAIVLFACGGGGGGDPCAHNFSGAWQTDAADHWKVCTLCNETGQKAAHTWDWVETQAATDTADGLETKTCTICNATDGTRPIPKLQGGLVENAFGTTTVTIKGDGSIPAADFDNAKDKLLDALFAIYDELVGVSGGTDKFDAMFAKSGFTIKITTGNVAPAASVDKKTMTIGVEYLLAEDPLTTVVLDVFTLVHTNDDFASDPTTREAGTVITLMKPDGVTSFGSATVKSSDAFTNSEWDTNTAAVKTALEAAYDRGDGANKSEFDRVFAGEVEIILGNNFTHNWEVKDGELDKMYIKVASISTADYLDAVSCMDIDDPWYG